MLSENEIQTKVNFLSSARCNHTFHKYIDITGDLIEGTLLSRILYWFAPSKDNKSKVKIYKDGEYWIAKQRKDWWEEIRITERQYDKAIKSLVKKKFVITAKYKFNSMPTIHIRPNYDVINAEVKKWEENIRQEVIAEDKGQELHKQADGNDTKCNSQGNNTKCNSGMSQDATLLTGITNNDYLNTNYDSLNTDKVHTSTNIDGEVHTSVSEKQTARVTRQDMQAKKDDMLNRFSEICDNSIENETIRRTVKSSFHRYMCLYENYFCKVHPILTDKTLTNVCLALSNVADTEHNHFEWTDVYLGDETGLTGLDRMANEHFRRTHRGQTNYSITHFAKSDYLLQLAQGIIEY